jgi:hypothetical protein
MSVSSEVKRTLVKSPPELWSELSDAEALSRHLDGLGAIRVTRAEPETAVDWEADGASGSVRLQPSGFGTKVTLSLSREVVETAEVKPESEASEAETTKREPELEVTEPEGTSESEQVPAPVIATESEVDPEPGVTNEPDPEPVIEMPAPKPVAEEQPRLGFFARMFRRRRRELLTPESIAVVKPEPEPVAAAEPEPVAATEPEPEPEPTPEWVEPEANVAADLATLEAEMAEQDEAMLTAMLDHLGAAHHRPFSRG